MKLLTSLVLMLITLSITGYSKKVSSNQEDTSIDVILFNLERDIEEVSDRLNCVLEILRTETTNPEAPTIYANALATEERIKLLREEFDQNTLAFFNNQSDAYFTLFRARLTHVRRTLQLFIKTRIPEVYSCIITLDISLEVNRWLPYK